MTRLPDNSGNEPWVLAITGASGAPYVVRLLQVLVEAVVPIQLIVSSHGWRLLETESGLASMEQLREATGGNWPKVDVFDDADRGASPASGSARSAGMVICPCSMGTISAIAHGTSRSLIERAGDVALKEAITSLRDQGLPDERIAEFFNAKEIPTRHYDVQRPKGLADWRSSDIRQINPG